MRVSILKFSFTYDIIIYYFINIKTKISTAS